jgi:hypothetical protein
MDTSFGATYEYEMGPLTLGYERWASLSPDTHELQSFGHASVSEEGTLEIKLMGIDGSVMFERLSLLCFHPKNCPSRVSVFFVPVTVFIWMLLSSLFHCI